MYPVLRTGQRRFLSTLSLRRATPPRHWHGGVTGHFYPRSPCGERRCMSRTTPVQAAISIHARLAESDRRFRAIQHPKINISIHALLAESDSKPRRLKSRRCVFLSTLSLRRATIREPRESIETLHFYPRSPCGERQINPTSHTNLPDFYPRSPCGERRESRQPSGRPTTYFYPRSPCGERQPSIQVQHLPKSISIHALLAESDAIHNAEINKHDNFYPRSPCGERRTSL